MTLPLWLIAGELLLLGFKVLILIILIRRIEGIEKIIIDNWKLTDERLNSLAFADKQIQHIVRYTAEFAQQARRRDEEIKSVVERIIGEKLP